jgi:NitT/TauT family transport system permease protein
MTRIVSSIAALVLVLLLWQGAVVVFAIPDWRLPAPTLIAQTLVADWSVLGPAFAATLRVTLAGLALATFGGIGIGLLASRSRVLENAISPLAVILQVTPLVAIAPLLILYIGPHATLYVAAFLVAFFPMLTGTLTGLRAVDPGLSDLFTVYGASPSQRLWRLEGPSALPFIMAGLRTAGGLALIGAVVAEFVAGTIGDQAGLAYRIVEASYRLNIPRLFAALFLIALTGVIIYALTGLASRIVLSRWSVQRASHPQ